MPHEQVPVASSPGSQSTLRSQLALLTPVSTAAMSFSSLSSEVMRVPTCDMISSSMLDGRWSIIRRDTKYLRISRAIVPKIVWRAAIGLRNLVRLFNGDNKLFRLVLGTSTRQIAFAFMDVEIVNAARQDIRYEHVTQEATLLAKLQDDVYYPCQCTP